MQRGSTPLCAAACFGRLDVVSALLNAGADKTIANNDFEKPIDIVCWLGNEQHKDAIVALLRSRRMRTVMVGFKSFKI